MENYKEAFIETAIACKALRFGDFTLKSGRKSPYFFNCGHFHTGGALSVLAEAYVATIKAAGLEFDGLFGPAYKGIPIAVAASLAFYSQGRDVPYTFDRKEAKDHGEGGLCVGAPLSGRIVLLDDVMTAGTAVKGSLPIIEEAGATLSGVVVALDRQERGAGTLSAVQEVAKVHQIPVLSILTVDDIVMYLQQDASNQGHIEAIAAYRDAFGVS